MAFTPPTFGTQITDPSTQWNKQQEEEQKKRDEQDRINCINSGGKWDKVNKTCSVPFEKQTNPLNINLPKKPETSEKAPRVKLTTPEVLKNNKGRTSGITLPGEGQYAIPTGKILPNGSQETRKATLEEYNNYRQSLGLGPTAEGRTYGGLKPDEVRQMAEAYQKKTALPAGTVPAGTAQQQADIQFALENQPLNYPTSQPVPEMVVNRRQAIEQAAAQVGLGLASVGGGALLAGGTAGAGTVPGAALMVAGFQQTLSGIKKYFSEVKGQRLSNVGDARLLGTKDMRFARSTYTDFNRGDISSAQASINIDALEKNLNNKIIFLKEVEINPRNFEEKDAADDARIYFENFLQFQLPTIKRAVAEGANPDYLPLVWEED